MSTVTPSAPGALDGAAGPVRAERRCPGRPGRPYLAGIALGPRCPPHRLRVTSTVVYGVVLGTLVVYVATRVVEGRRKAADRLVTCLVTTAFGIAMIPLVSLVYTVLDKAWRASTAFFTNSMFGCRRGRRRHHAIVGTLVITALATLISVPIGLMTAIYLVEYGARTTSGPSRSSSTS